MIIEKTAYMSKLRNADPLLKTLFALAFMIICVAADSFAVSFAAAAVMLSLVIFAGGAPVKTVARLMKIPMFFIIAGTVAIAFTASDIPSDMVIAARIGARFYGIGKAGLIMAARAAAKCFGAVNCMYFLSLTTPMNDLLTLLRKSPLPDFFAEITELVYRYIFVLFETARKMRTAQDARLGYSSLKTSYKSTGVLAANLFIRAFERADRAYTAMQSRGYDGSVAVFSDEYEKKPYQYVLAALAAVIFASFAYFCGRRGI